MTARALSLLLLSISLLSANPARAQGPQPPRGGSLGSAERHEQARRLAAQAPAAFDRKDYRRARELLEEAYRLYPSAKLKYSLGRVYDAEGRSVLAATAFQAFLDEVPPEDRVVGQTEEVTAALRRLSRHLGRLQVRGAAGSWLQLDGGPRQTMPIGDQWAEPGTHHVTCAGGDLEVEVHPGGVASVYLVGAPAEPAPPPLSAARPAARPLRVLKWALLGAGVAAVVAGGALFGVDGQQRCDLASRQLQCPDVLSTRGGGIGLLVTGAALLAGSGVMFGLDLRAAARTDRAALVQVGGTF